jgi:hypothetical protein
MLISVPSEGGVTQEEKRRNNHPATHIKKNPDNAEGTPAVAIRHTQGGHE